MCQAPIEIEMGCFIILAIVESYNYEKSPFYSNFMEYKKTRQIKSVMPLTVVIPQRFDNILLG